VHALIVVQKMDEAIPAEIDLNKLPGPTRGVYPALYFRDEIVYSPSGRHFALAYSICEHSYGNEVGMALWGEMDQGRLTRSQPIQGLTVCCWQAPWCRWIDDDTLLCKAQRSTRHGVTVPDVLIRTGEFFAVIPRDARSEVWLPEPDISSVEFQRIEGSKLVEAIEKTAQQAAS
jgi:hypothetical protein